MAAGGRGLLLYCFETASIEMNMTKQTCFNFDMYTCILVTNWDVNCDNCWMNSFPGPIVQLSAVKNS